jgi:hypothetical protein
MAIAIGLIASSPLTRSVSTGARRLAPARDSQGVHVVDIGGADPRDLSGRIWAAAPGVLVFVRSKAGKPVSLMSDLLSIQIWQGPIGVETSLIHSTRSGERC